MVEWYHEVECVFIEPGVHIGLGQHDLGNYTFVDLPLRDPFCIFLSLRKRV